MKISVIHAGNFKLDGGAMFGVVPKSIWNKLNPADENNMCSWALRCLLVEEGDTRLLIDTGMGTKQEEKFYSHYYLHGNQNLLSSLEVAGYSPDSITDVLHTHLHFDHCGGSIGKQNGLYFPVFPNARYWVDKSHWEWAINPNAREKASFLKENLLPMQESGVLNFLPEGPASPWPWLELFRAYGHTEAMVLPVIHSQKRRLVFCADLFPSVHHIPMPYIMGYDMRPLETLADKTRFFDRALKEEWVLFFEHDPAIECAVLEMGEKGVRIRKTFSLSEAAIG